ncbi:hypothetical protein F4775DRAFT_565422 [Biscogniauxia sp. FL1348]|nr:hypothetical protein F4775DRAFT_565422 [Biscogniauxia sp. FL1348]
MLWGFLFLTYAISFFLPAQSLAASAYVYFNNEKMTLSYSEGNEPPGFLYFRRPLYPEPICFSLYLLFLSCHIEFPPYT